MKLRIDITEKEDAKILNKLAANQIQEHNSMKLGLLYPENAGFLLTFIIH